MSLSIPSATLLPSPPPSPEFQRLYTPSAFREERIHWHSIIQLNLIRSVHTILDTLDDVRPHELPSAPPSPSSSPPLGPRRLAPSLYSARQTFYGDSASDTDSAETPPAPALPTHLVELRARLEPLRRVEALLLSRLVPPSEDAPFLPERPRADSTGEVFVRPGSWKRGWRFGPFGGGGHGPVGEEERELAGEVQNVLWRCSSDLMSLWYDMTVRAILKKRKIRLEESPGL